MAKGGGKRSASDRGGGDGSFDLFYEGGQPKRSLETASKPGGSRRRDVWIRVYPLWTLYQSEQVRGVYHVLPPSLDTDPYVAVGDHKQKEEGGEYSALQRFPWAVARARPPT